MAKMDELIMSTPALRHLKPARGWAKQLFKFTNKSSIRAMSVGSGAWAHPQIVVLDDILSSEAPTQLKSIATWFYTALLPVLHHTAQMCIVGTPFHSPICIQNSRIEGVCGQRTSRYQRTNGRAPVA